MAEENIKSLTQANAALAESYDDLSDSLLRQLNTSKAWNFISRMTSGSGFWKIQNKVRAVTDAYVVMDDAMKDSIKTQTKAAQTMEKLRKVQEKMPQRDADDDFNPQDLMELPEYKQQIETYVKAFDGDEEKARTVLLENIESQLVANENMLGGLEAQMIDGIRYQEMGWRLDKKLAFKVLKFQKVVTGVAKAASRFLVQASIGFLLLILLIPLAIKFFKNFKGILETLGVSLGIDDIKKGFKFVMGILSKLFEVIKLVFAGDVLGALKIYIFDILIPIAGKIGKGLFAVGKIIIALILAGLKTVVNAMISVVNKIPGVNIPKLARGGTVRTGGMAIVGENGPELVSLPKAATVHSNTQSKQMMSGNTINVHVNGRVGANDAEIRDIAQKVAREINLQMNRTTSAVGRF